MVASPIGCHSSRGGTLNPVRALPDARGLLTEQSVRVYALTGSRKLYILILSLLPITQTIIVIYAMAQHGENNGTASIYHIVVHPPIKYFY